jgi:hypothetical protein
MIIPRITNTALKTIQRKEYDDSSARCNGFSPSGLTSALGYNTLIRSSNLY